ncbi:cyclin-domain-containing protein [Auricularia subglabra TFB-10046 SS5]|nr:cyclin-domain-containing protein [Auricularia subglabra TFB-10046 SS5]
MLALAATPALQHEHTSSWHSTTLRRSAVRSHSHSHSHSNSTASSQHAHPPEHPHAAPPHKLARTTSTPHPLPASEPVSAPHAPESLQPSQRGQPSIPHSAPRPQEKTERTRHAAVDIHSIPQQELLKHLANLLQQIATANDALPSPSAAQAPAPVDPSERPPIWLSLTTASRAAFGDPQAPLAFHARNVPTITLEAYLLRILKYCPISNEVFLSLLVYFDRMTRLARETTGAVFAIDSYNVHRLVIAGITVASKFLSDVFYTNTRYAKVGGLPQAELNQLELQFLLLNDFHLVISNVEMQNYAEDLMAFATASVLPPVLANPASYEPQQSHWTAIREAPRDDQDESASSTLGEGGETTDDEPTIRPAHSSASSETQSIFTVTSEDTDADRDADETDVFGRA